MSRREFPAKVRRLAAKRSGGRCERYLWRADRGLCIRPPVHFDHIMPDGLGGEATIENCAHLCKQCHADKTLTEDMPRMRKADAQWKAAHGVKPATAKIKSRPKLEKRPSKPSLPPRRLYQ